MRTGNRQGGGTQARQAKLSEQPAAPVYITHKITYYDFLGEDALAAIEAQALRYAHRVPELGITSQLRGVVDLYDA